MTDFIRGKGTAAFGTRLRRLSEALDRDVQALYRAHDARFESRWFPVVAALLEHGPLSVGELAAMIGITHAAVSQVRGELIAQGLICVAADPTDRRRQILSLSASGRRQSEVLQPLWKAIALSTDALCADEAPQLLAHLDRIEAALARKSMTARVAEALQSQKGDTRLCPV
jgi:DNA-binding MarR family transcriptional regulator